MKNLILSLIIILSVGISTLYTGYYLKNLQQKNEEALDISNVLGDEKQESTKEVVAENKQLISPVVENPIQKEEQPYVPPSIIPTETTPIGTGTIIHIDTTHANIGRLFNLHQVAQSLNGRILKPGF